MKFLKYLNFVIYGILIFCIGMIISVSICNQYDKKNKKENWEIWFQAGKVMGRIELLNEQRRRDLMVKDKGINI